MTGDGNSLGTEPTYDKSDQLSVRNNNNATAADKIESINFKVELLKAR